MRLANFLEESNNIEEDKLIEFLKKDCSKILSILPGGSLLFRAEEKSLVKNNINIINTRPKRSGRTQLYELIDKWLVKNNFASRINNCFFCNGEISQTFSYGEDMETTVVFPIGNFTFSYVESHDFNFDYDYTGYHPEFLSWAVRDEMYKIPNDKARILDINKNIVPLEETYKPSDLEVFLPDQTYVKSFDSWSIKDLLKLDVKKFFHNNNIGEALGNDYEIWFNCRSYCSIKLDFAKEIF